MLDPSPAEAVSTAAANGGVNVDMQKSVRGRVLLLLLVVLLLTKCGVHTAWRTRKALQGEAPQRRVSAPPLAAHRPVTVMFAGEGLSCVELFSRAVWRVFEKIARCHKRRQGLSLGQPPSRQNKCSWALWVAASKGVWSGFPRSFWHDNILVSP